jgi:talin
VGSQAGGSDHGLYFPAQSKWLINSKTLDFYDFKSGDLVEFRKKHRPLKVRMMDNSLKTVLIDESLPVSQLVDAVCRKIGIANPEEYSFCREKSASGSEGNLSKGADFKGTVKGKSAPGSDKSDKKIADEVDECK